MELSRHCYHDLTEIIRAESGIVLGDDKAYLVHHRLEPLVREKGFTGFDDLVQRLRAKAATGLRTAMIDAITVKETRFFRDQGFFDALKEHVLPGFAATLGKAGGRQRMRIWSAAASTGQEAYSIAILVHEMLEREKLGRVRAERFSILASDISPAAIDAAKSGHYSQSDVHRGVSEARLRKHFRHHGARWHIDDSLRRQIQFRTFNLLESPADLGPFDLILCRNVLIYFDEPTRRRICRELLAALQPGGWLGLGSAESLYGVNEHFETVVLGKTLLYRKAGKSA